MFKCLLVPVDLAEPETAAPALNRAVALAKASDGTVRLIHVRSILPVSYMEFVPPAFDVDQQRDCEDRLATIAAGLDLPEDRVSTVVRMGSVYAEVLDEAKTVGADLVVVGSHRPSMATYLIGSNAATIVRQAACSVLVVRE